MPERREIPPPDPVVVSLANGRRARIRPLRPEDAPRIVKGFERLSPQSRRQRFLGPVDRLTPEEIEYLSHPDMVDHLALGMEVLSENEEEPPVGIGVARCVRLDEADLAEMAVTVADDWQRQGAGAALVHELAVWSRRAGMTRWLGIILTDNVAIRKLLNQVGTSVSARAIGEGVVEAIWELDAPL